MTLIGTETPKQTVVHDAFHNAFAFSATTGLITQAGFQSGQKIKVKDTDNIFEWSMPSTSTNPLDLVGVNCAVLVRIIDNTLVRGVMVQTVAATGHFATPSGADVQCQAVLLRDGTATQSAYGVTGSSRCLILVANAQTINSGVKFSNDASGLATVAAVTKVSAVSIDTAARAGNGTSVFVLAELIPVGI